MTYEIFDSLIAKHYEDIKDLPAPLRQSRLFQYYTQEIPIQILPEDLIAGRYGYAEEQEPAFDKTPAFSSTTHFSKEEAILRNRLSKEYLIDTNFTSAHTCIDYQTILQKGLQYYIQKVESALTDKPDHEYLKAMLHSLHRNLRICNP